MLLEGKENLDDINNTSILDATNNYLIGTEIFDSHLFLCTPDVMAFTLILHLIFFFFFCSFFCFVLIIFVFLLFLGYFFIFHMNILLFPGISEHIYVIHVYLVILCYEYREKTWKAYIYIFLINFIINNILSENLLTNVRCFLLELCLTRKVLRETGGFVALFFFSRGNGQICMFTLIWA